SPLLAGGNAAHGPLRLRILGQKPGQHRRRETERTAHGNLPAAPGRRAGVFPGGNRCAFLPGPGLSIRIPSAWKQCTRMSEGGQQSSDMKMGRITGLMEMKRPRDAAFSFGNLLSETL